VVRGSSKPPVSQINYQNPFVQVKPVKESSFSLDRLFLKLKSTGPQAMLHKIEVLQSLLSFLVDHDSKTLVQMYENDQVFPLIVNYFLDSHIS
jgi:hypothetical protein